MRATHALNGIGLLLLLWQAGTWLFAPPRYILPSPADVAAAFWRQPGFLFGQAMVTSGEMAFGLAAGIAAGILVAFTVAAIPRLGRLVWPMVLVLQAFPVFVLAPILVLWFGFGVASKVVMTAIINATVMPASPSIPIVIIALLVSVGVGVAAGVAPALRGARLDPIEALRHE